jgi:hypothetical protein
LNKQEALEVINEIQDTQGANIAVTCVSLDPEQVDGKVVGYGIRLKCTLDSISRKAIEPILNKHKLELREANGYLFIIKQH